MEHTAITRSTATVNLTIDQLTEKVMASDTLVRELGLNRKEHEKSCALLKLQYSREDLQVFLNDVID